MKKAVFIIMSVYLLSACAKPLNAPNYSGERVEVSFNYNKRSGFSSNQFVVWVEDENGDYITTLFATEKTTTGGIWEKREYSLYNWRKKSGLENMSHGEMDAFSGATPKAKKNPQKYAWRITDKNSVPLPDGKYNIFVEGTIYSSHYVVYKATIETGNRYSYVKAIAFYSSEEAKTSNMIENVSVSYHEN